MAPNRPKIASSRVWGGASFVDFGEECSSMLMSGFFALAVLAYAWLLYALPAA